MVAVITETTEYSTMSLHVGDVMEWRGVAVAATPRNP
jgi:hypothetical protein